MERVCRCPVGLNWGAVDFVSVARVAFKDAGNLTAIGVWPYWPDVGLATDQLFDQLLFPLVSLAVAVILFEGGSI